MYNLLIAIAAAVLAFGLTFATGLVDWWGALFPFVLAFGVVYFLLARRTLAQLETLYRDAQAEIMAKRIPSGIAKIESGFELAKWQFFVKPQVHAQLGSLLYMLEKYDEARPHLEKSFARIGQARAMYAALLFREKNDAKMIEVFEDALKYTKNDGLLWSTYAWCLHERGQTAKAMDVLGRATKENPSDQKLKDNQLSLQNEKGLKMNPYGMEWWAYRLEAPPSSVAPPQAKGFAVRKGYRNPPATRR